MLGEALGNQRMANIGAGRPAEPRMVHGRLEGQQRQDMIDM